MDPQTRTLQSALTRQKTLVVVGTPNAYCALLAQRAGIGCIYLSGAGVANAAFGLPDLGLTSLQDLAEETRRIRRVCSLPLLVDADTGWDDPALAVETLQDAGASAIHLEDQVAAKRCGHLQGKNLVSPSEMCARIQATLDARHDRNFAIMARTDAHAVEGLAAAIDRAQRYCGAGADMIFAEALTSLEEYRQFTAAVTVPVLANITEFGKTPLFSVAQLAQVGVRLALFPLSAFRSMSAAALNVYQTIRKNGSQEALIDTMQTRADLYEIIAYRKWEQELAKSTQKHQD